MCLQYTMRFQIYSVFFLHSTSLCRILFLKELSDKWMMWLYILARNLNSTFKSFQVVSTDRYILLWKVGSIFKTWSTLKCRNALIFNFTFQTLFFCLKQWTRVNLNSNRTEPILCRLGFNFDGAARLFTVPGLSQAYFTYPTSLVQCV